MSISLMKRKWTCICGFNAVYGGVHSLMGGASLSVWCIGSFSWLCDNRLLKCVCFLNITVM